MIRYRPFALFALLAATVNLSIAAPPSQNDSAPALPRMAAPSMSPDARYVSFLAVEGGRGVVRIMDLERDDEVRQVPDHGQDEGYSLDWCGWVNSERLLCGYHASESRNGQTYDLSRLVAVNIDGSQAKVVLQQARAGGSDQTRPRVLLWMPRGLKTVKLELHEDGQDYPSVQVLDAYSGKLTRDVAAQAPIRHFSTSNRDDEVVFGWGHQGKELQCFSRGGKKKKEWRRLQRVQPATGPEALQPLADQELGTKIWAMGKHEGRDAVWLIDLDDLEDARAIAYGENADGASPFYSAKGRLFGIRYRTDPSATIFGVSDVQSATERFSGTAVRVVDYVINPRRFLVYAERGEKDGAGRYHLYDVSVPGTGQRELGVPANWTPPTPSVAASPRPQPVTPPSPAVVADALRGEPLDLLITVVDEANAPVVGLPLRVVLSSDPHSRAPGAGRPFVTDAKGRVRETLDVTMTTRRVPTDIPFMRRKTEMFEIGLEPGFGGTPLLYTLELDSFSVYTLISATPVFMPASDGTFTKKVNLNWEGHGITEHRYDKPPQDERFDPIANPPPARLAQQNLTLQPHPRVDGSRRWTLDLRLVVVRYRPQAP